jgi:hypothetical protein
MALVFLNNVGRPQATPLLHSNEAEIQLPQSGVLHVRVSQHSELVELIGQDGCPEAQRLGGIHGVQTSVAYGASRNR